ncbi:hypothetical protein RM555_23000 [Micromonospora sp. DSM 115977]|uniref:EVE domain-containing protein n=1 Tax=Micromonospora reichwaldensis TaxID=3075516 RepID=A0ABU2X114_9ACTN|nr:hypothetical protein [Micromonospora sp. DSM 115977]MDT0531865.1 hypothetical protein [Micromonospora sp. DSM 115977]
MSSYLVVLGERDAIWWVLHEQRMAFPATPRAEVADLAPGDRLFLYATRSAWNNPPRDRGRVIGVATAATAARRLDQPIEIAQRSFHSACELRIDGVVPYPGGLELGPLVDRLDAFPKPHAWSVYLRRALVRLSDSDRAILDQGLNPMLAPRGQALPTYPSMRTPPRKAGG